MKIRTKFVKDVYIGQVFDRLEVLQLEKRPCSNGRIFLHAYVKCKCGNEKWVQCYNLVQLHTKSCGCLRNDLQATVRNGKCGDIYGGVLLRVESSAKRMGREFNLTKEYVSEVWEAQNKQCALTGMELTWKRTAETKGTTASIDRIDSSKGYIEGNIQIVHKIVNIMKMQHSQEDFIEWCNKVSSFAGSMVLCGQTGE